MLHLKNKRIIAAALAVVVVLSSIPVVGVADMQAYCGLEHEHVASCYVDPNTTSAFLDNLLAAQTLQELYDRLASDETTAASLSTAQLSQVRQRADTICAEVQMTEEDVTNYRSVADLLVSLSNRRISEAEKSSQIGGNSNSGGSTTVPTDPPSIPEQSTSSSTGTAGSTASSMSGTSKPAATQSTPAASENTYLEKVLAAQTLQELYDRLSGDETAASGLNASQLSLVRQRADTIYAEAQPTEENATNYQKVSDLLVSLVNQRISEAEKNSQPSDTSGILETEKTLAEKLLAAQTLQAVYELLMADAALTNALTAEELAAVKLYVAELYAALEVPATEEETYYNLINEKVANLQNEQVTMAAYHSLMAAGSIAALYDLLYEQGNIYMLENMSDDMLAALSARADALYDPETDDFELYEMIKDGINSFADTLEEHPKQLFEEKSGPQAGETITTDTNWTLVGDMTLTGTISVKNGATLTINGAGTIKRTAGNDMFNVSGGSTLNIQGDDGSMIVLNGNDKIGCGIKVSGTPKSTVNLNNVTIKKTDYSAISIEYSCKFVLNVDSSVIDDCSADEGSAVYFRGDCDGDATFIKTEIKNCRATGGNAGTIRTNGGGKVVLLLEQCIFENNYSSDNGGVVYWNACGKQSDGDIARVDIYDCQFLNNQAVNMGGAIFNEAFMGIGTRFSSGFTTTKATVGNIKGILIQGNTAKTGAGILMNTYSGKQAAHNEYGAELTLGAGQFIIGNRATESGGGLAMKVGLGSLTAGSPTVAFKIDCDGAVIQNNTAPKGAGVYVSKFEDYFPATVNLNSGVISGNKATRDGGAVAFVNTSETTKVCEINIGQTGSDNLLLQNNTATNNGGAIYIQKGDVNMFGGIVENNKATQYGGALCIEGGNFVMTGGDMLSNEATNGGGAYVNGGNFTISSGEIRSNTANANGGGVAVNNGKVEMTGGSISGNKASTGAGGGMFVSSTGTNPVTVNIFSGNLSGNSASQTGGAVGVHGENGEITVQIGVNENHYSGGSVAHNFSHTVDGVNYNSTSCPVIQNNSSGTSGGAFHIKGASTTKLCLYCLTDGDNKTQGDINPLKENMSDFMMVEGGTVWISTGTNYDAGVSPDGDHVSGYMTIHDSIHVVGGVLELFGSKSNPSLEDSLTIDLRNKDDKFVDHRSSKSIYTVSYHENFYQPDGTPNSTQTVFDVNQGTDHVIHGGLYVHEGYQLYGWNVNEKANAIATKDGWYKATDKYKFVQPTTEHPDGTRDEENHIQYGNLMLYAIWKVNGYFVEFVAGVPEDQTWTGETKTETHVYNKEGKLPDNWFVWPGHAFDGWVLPDGTVKQSGETFKNLTNKNAETVTITACWKDCDHPTCTVTANADEGTLTKTCSVCGYSATAKLTAENAVYDGALHEATVEYSDEEFWKDSNNALLTIRYAGKTIRPQNAGDTWTPQTITNSKLCIGAGEYTASITSGGATVSVEYTIEKAKQDAPKSRPNYLQPEENSNILKVVQIPSTERLSTQSQAHVQYIVRYVENNVEVDGQVVIPEEAEPEQLEYELPAALKVYSVLAYYPETDDYLASNLVSAELSFLFSGQLSLKIDAQEGIDFWLGRAGEEGAEQLILYAKVQDEYYRVGSEFIFEKSLTSCPENYEYDPNYLSIAAAGSTIPNGYTMNVLTEPTQEVEITVYIKGVKKKATLEGYAKEKQHFSDFSGVDSIAISRNSAFTVRFDSEDFDRNDYQVPELRFTTQGVITQSRVALPAGTTIILRDRTTESYWSTTIDTATDVVTLSSFKSMTPAQTPYTVSADSELQLQFVVDFSRCSSPISENDLICTMYVGNKAESPNAKALEETVTVELAGYGLRLSAPVIDNGHGTLTNKLKIEAGAGAAASKYDHRDMALVVTPKAGTNLPADASIRMSLAGENTTWRPDSQGRFYISLGNYRSLNTDFTLELKSSMFPVETKTYYLEAALYLSNTDAEDAPFKEAAINVVDLEFKSDRDKTGIKITVPSGQRLFTTSDDITAVVTVVKPIYATYEVAVELHQEFGDTFGDTTISPQVDPSAGTYTFDLAGRTTGDYCIVASLRNSRGYVVNESKYYFIIHPAENSGN